MLLTFFFVNLCSYHGPTFRDWMDAINARSIEDRLTDEFSTMMPHLMFLYFTCATQRPSVGYCITTTSDFSREKFSSGNSVEVLLFIVILFRSPFSLSYCQ
jgi:hypothetical protein